MADRNALSMLGLIFTGVAVAVVVIAYVVVRDHMDGRSSLEAKGTVAASTIQWNR